MRLCAYPFFLILIFAAGLATVIQGCRELLTYGRKGLGILTALAPGLLLGLIGIIKSVNVPELGSVKVPTPIEQKTSEADRTKGHPTLSYFEARFRCVKRVTSSGGN